MKIQTEQGDIYVKASSLLAVSVRKYENYNSKDEKYDIMYGVDISTSIINVMQILSTKDKEEANRIANILGKAVEDNDSANIRNTVSEDNSIYLKGFKEGTEYALRLMKEPK